MVAADDIARMRAHLFFEGADVRARQSRFWLLLVLSAIIATAGVGGDSTATVIGAMIVAPLMTPILGVVLAMVLNDRRNLLRSIAMVVAGACVVVALGYLIGLAIPEPVTAATNSQVASRVSPRLVDLLAALATGAVGSVALIRSDISDTLPGVAIAISLVPPLSVVGLTLESGVYGEARGALLLFLANVSAILATGVLVMALYGLLSAVPAGAEGAAVEPARRARCRRAVDRHRGTADRQLDTRRADHVGAELGLPRRDPVGVRQRVEPRVVDPGGGRLHRSRLRAAPGAEHRPAAGRPDRSRPGRRRRRPRTDPRDTAWFSGPAARDSSAGQPARAGAATAGPGQRWPPAARLGAQASLPTVSGSPGQRMSA